MSSDLNKLKVRIVEALNHPEASDGLYFRNFCNLHEEDERPAVEGEQEEVLDALMELIREGEVTADDSDEEVIFRLTNSITSH